MSKSYNDYIDENMVDGANLTPEQAAQMLEIAMGNGDTAQADSIETPADTANEGAEDKPSDDIDLDNIDPSKAVLLARDGVHQIPFEQLLEAREQANVSKEALAAANAELEELRAKVAGTPAEQTKQEQDIETAQAAIDAGVDPSVFGDFDEEGISSGIAKLVAEQVAAAMAPMQQQTEAQRQAAIEQAHWDKIFSTHEDADSVVQSVEFNKWRESQPSFTQAAIEGVFKSGTADQVVELLDNFKKSQNSTQSSAATQPDLKSKADEVVKGIKTPAPVSLSDMPGHAGPTSITEQMKDMSGADALAVMDKMTPEQIERHLNSL